MLRAFLYIIKINPFSSQLSLYIHGPGGTGKSSLINILLYLLGPEASTSSSLNTLTSRFGPSSL
jgi:phage/plasmid-associated DNA primase